MASKTIDIKDLGPVNFSKRRGARNLRVSVTDSGVIRVSFPWWVSYEIARRFLNSRKDWVLSKRSETSFLFEPGQQIGKSHRLVFKADMISQIRTRLVGNEIVVYHPDRLHLDHEKLQIAATKAVVRALHKESKTLLNIRLAELARQHGFSYSKAHFRVLKSRWGSCNTDGKIVLNIFLLQLPWHLVDYVIVHELAHTKAMNHSPKFWQLVESKMPDFKLRRKELKRYRPTFKTQSVA